MKYQYACDKCKTNTMIDKPISECSRVELCEKCKSEMKRVYSVGGIKTADGIK